MSCSLSSGSSRGRPAKLTPPTAYTFTSFWNPAKSLEDIIDLTAPTVARAKSPHSVASTLVVDTDLASCSGRPSFASIDYVTMDATENATVKHTPIVVLEPPGDDLSFWRHSSPSMQRIKQRDKLIHR